MTRGSVAQTMRVLPRLSFPSVLPNLFRVHLVRCKYQNPKKAGCALSGSLPVESPAKFVRYLVILSIICSNRSMQKYWVIVKSWFSDWRAYIAEFLGTFLFVFVANGAVVVNFLYGDIKTLGLAITIGFSYAVLLFMTIYRSQGYLNPAVTIALWLVKKISPINTFFYIIMQVLASFAAAGLLLLIFGQSAKEIGLGGPTLGVNVELSSAVLVEAILTAGLIFAVFATIVDRRGPVSFGPVAAGLFVVAAAMVAIPVSGAGFNPARAIGPGVFSNSTSTLAVWIIGPLSGSLFALFYEVVFLRKGKK